MHSHRPGNADLDGSVLRECHKAAKMAGGQPTGKCGNAPSLPDEVTQILQLNGEVHAVDHHVFRHIEHDGREVQDGLDT